MRKDARRTVVRKRTVLRPWVKAALLALVGLLAYIITTLILGGDDGIPERPPSPRITSQVPQGESSAPPLSESPTEPTPDYTGLEGTHPYSYKVCQILDGAYIGSKAEADALDSRLYGYYQSVKDENAVIASFIKDLHEDTTNDLEFFNELLATDIPEECD